MAAGGEVLDLGEAASLATVGVREGVEWVEGLISGGEATAGADSSVAAATEASSTDSGGQSTDRPIYATQVREDGTFMEAKGFLAAERNVLVNRGWSQDPATRA